MYKTIKNEFQSIRDDIEKSFYEKSIIDHETDLFFSDRKIGIVLDKCTDIYKDYKNLAIVNKKENEFEKFNSQIDKLRKEYLSVQMDCLFSLEMSAKQAKKEYKIVADKILNFLDDFERVLLSFEKA